MKVLLDTNVVLDVLLDRDPYAEAATDLLSKAETGGMSGYLCATTVTTIYYISVKALGTASVRRSIQKLLSLFEVAPVNRPVLEAALGLKFSDFEDAVLHEAARQVGADAIVTRNREDFRRASLPVYSPDEFVAILESKQD